MHEQSNPGQRHGSLEPIFTWRLAIAYLAYCAVVLGVVVGLVLAGH